MGKKHSIGKSCILLIGKQENLNRSAILFAQQILDIKALVRHEDKHLDEEFLAQLKPDFVLSFLSEKILKGPLLRCPNVNFHPAPPEWPGRGGASLAIYHRAETYGATAHIMNPIVDSGPILAVQRFPILPGESCESLFDRAEHACLELFYEVGAHISAQGGLPKISGENWKRKPMTRKQFEKWLVLNEKDKDDFIRKIQAARHSQYPGPYVFIHGHKFALLEDAD
jgi:methionyl-tRNA formyltransferase